METILAQTVFTKCIYGISNEMALTFVSAKNIINAKFVYASDK